MHQYTRPVRRPRALMGLSLMLADAVVVDLVKQHGGSVLNRVCVCVIKRACVARENSSLPAAIDLVGRYKKKIPWKNTRWSMKKR